MGICATFACFQTLRLRKRGCLHETGFYLPHRYHFDGRSSSESKELQFRLLEIEANAVIYIRPTDRPTRGGGRGGDTATRRLLPVRSLQANKQKIADIEKANDPTDLTVAT